VSHSGILIFNFQSLKKFKDRLVKFNEKSESRHFYIFFVLMMWKRNLTPTIFLQYNYNIVPKKLIKMIFL